MSAPTLATLHATHRVVGDVAATADVLVKVLRLTPTQADVLMPLILGYCDLWERGRVRSIEHRSVTRKGRPVEAGGGYRLLLAETFALPDGRRVSWGEATVEQHEARAMTPPTQEAA